jgi:Zn-dependent peptidase ImmA (M78 family)
MAGGFYRGFKTHAERISMEMRGELGLEAEDRLDPILLAEHLAIPVLGLRALAAFGASRDVIAHFYGPGSGDFSAATVFRGSRRGIVLNDRHALTRRASSLAHEISHVLLEHEPRPIRGADGCRDWTPEAEREASWLGAALLVPRPAAVLIARSGESSAVAAARMGVSLDLMDWRLSETGARVQALRAKARR